MIRSLPRADASRFKCRPFVDATTEFKRKICSKCSYRALTANPHANVTSKFKRQIHNAHPMTECAVRMGRL